MFLIHGLAMCFRLQLWLVSYYICYMIIYIYIYTVYIYIYIHPHSLRWVFKRPWLLPGGPSGPHVERLHDGCTVCGFMWDCGTPSSDTFPATKQNSLVKPSDDVSELGGIAAWSTAWSALSTHHPLEEFASEWLRSYTLRFCTHSGFNKSCCGTVWTVDWVLSGIFAKMVQKNPGCYWRLTLWKKIGQQKLKHWNMMEHSQWVSLNGHVQSNSVSSRPERAPIHAVQIHCIGSMSRPMHDAAHAPAMVEKGKQIGLTWFHNEWSRWMLVVLKCPEQNVKLC